MEPETVKTAIAIGVRICSSFFVCLYLLYLIRKHIPGGPLPLWFPLAFFLTQLSGVSMILPLALPTQKLYIVLANGTSLFSFSTIVFLPNIFFGYQLLRLLDTRALVKVNRTLLKFGVIIPVLMLIVVSFVFFFDVINNMFPEGNLLSFEHVPDGPLIPYKFSRVAMAVTALAIILTAVIQVIIFSKGISVLRSDEQRLRALHVVMLSVLVQFLGNFLGSCSSLPHNHVILTLGAGLMDITCVVSISVSAIVKQHKWLERCMTSFLSKTLSLFNTKKSSVLDEKQAINEPKEQL